MFEEHHRNGSGQLDLSNAFDEFPFSIINLVWLAGFADKRTRQKCVENKFDAHRDLFGHCTCACEFNQKQAYGRCVCVGVYGFSCRRLATKTDSSSFFSHADIIEKEEQIE